MLTVTVGLDESGKSSTLSPLSSRYSVIPSTAVTLTGAAWAAGAEIEATTGATMRLREMNERMKTDSGPRHPWYQGNHARPAPFAGVRPARRRRARGRRPGGADLRR